MLIIIIFYILITFYFILSAETKMSHYANSVIQYRLAILDNPIRQIKKVEVSFKDHKNFLHPPSQTYVYN